MARTPQTEPVIIKKYTNRRLYNTQISNYVTLNDLCDMVKRSEEFVVKDARTGEDLTHLILTQIIFEQELKGYNLLPISFLRQMICFYDDNLRTVVPKYLEGMMGYFSQHQEQMRQTIESRWAPMEGFSPLKMFEEMGKQQLAAFDQMVNFFNAMTPQGNSEETSTKKSSTTSFKESK